jgi:hypothetical protein
MNRGDIEAASGAGCTYPSRVMEIRISIETTQPLTGAAMTESEGPLPFAGWLELLRAVSTLVGADVDAAGGMLAASHDPRTSELSHDHDAASGMDASAVAPEDISTGGGTP